jgi:RNA recognition motif-containing protein
VIHAGRPAADVTGAHWRVESPRYLALQQPNKEYAMGQKLYVGNLGFEVTSQELQDVFTTVGPCTSVTVLLDRTTGQSRGFGFVEMTSNSDAQKAVQQLDGREIKGRAIKVSEARERSSGGGASGDGRGAYNRW